MDTIPELVYALLPGFVSAWIFYGLSAYSKPPTFERVIQALVFTLIAEFFAQLVGFCLLYIGSSYSVGTWTEQVYFAWKVLWAIVIGFSAVIVTKNNLFQYLPYWLTRKTTYPSEWFSSFDRNKTNVYLHLSGERRLRGWPEEWPDDPEKGHFVMMNAAWILDDNTEVHLSLTSRILIPAKDVELVEFEKEVFSQEDLKAAEVDTKVMIKHNDAIEKLIAKVTKSDEPRKLTCEDEQNEPESNSITFE